VAVALAAYIKDNYSGTRTWLDAAYEFRFPFWDWVAKDATSGAVGIPDALSNDSIQILDPTKSDGTTQISIANPLSFYPFPDIPSGFTTVTYQDDSGVSTRNSLSLLDCLLHLSCYDRPQSSHALVTEYTNGIFR
jgi:hypothetical protein